MTADTYLSAIMKRRSIYALDASLEVPKERVVEIVEKAVIASPSAFHSQSARVVILFDDQHKELWKIVLEALRAIVPVEAFAATEEKIQSFAAAAGTVLYYDDKRVVEGLQDQFPAYADNFPVWASQANAMVQENVWNALALDGVGASLQHYNPLIDEAVREKWNVPASYKLVAEMPFGRIVAAAAEKQNMDVKDRVKVYGL